MVHGTAASADRAPLVAIWWLEPSLAFVLVTGVTILAAAATPVEWYRAYGTPKHIQGKDVGLAALGILAFVSGGRLASSIPFQPLPLRGADPRLRRWFYYGSGLTLVGYLVWLAVARDRGLTPSLLMEMLRGTDDEVAERIKREVLLTVPGVTTCTQFGVASAILGCWLLGTGARGVMPMLALVFGLAVARAFFRSERLAVLELCVPCVVLALRVRCLGRPAGRALRWALRGAPLLGVLGAAVFFSGFEYFRSWRFYRHEEESFAAFAAWRLAAYYVTAHNNGAMALRFLGPLPLPYYTLAPFWEFPLVKGSSLSYRNLTGMDPEESHAAMLERFGAPEFNNEGGLFLPMLDFGLLGFGLFWFACGWVCTRAYRGFLVGSASGLLCYPILYLSLLEVPRLLYLLSTRSLPAWLMIAAVLAALRLSPGVGRRARETAEPPAERRAPPW